MKEDKSNKINNLNKEKEFELNEIKSFYNTKLEKQLQLIDKLIIDKKTLNTKCES